MSSRNGKRDELMLEEQPAPAGQPVSRYLDGLAPGSRRTLRQALDRIASLLTKGRAKADTLAWHNLKPRHAAALREQLTASYSPATTNKMLSAFRGVLREAWSLGYLKESEYRKVAALPSVKNRNLSSGRTLGAREVRALFVACSRDGAACSRDAALLALLYGGGLRRSEAVSLALEDYDASTGIVRVRGPERKERVVKAEGQTQAALDAWVGVRGRSAGPLLCPVDKAGRVRIRYMTDQAVLYIVRRLALAAGIRRFSPHDLRRSFFYRMRQRPAKAAGRRRARSSAARMSGTREQPGEMLEVPFQGCG